MRNKKIKTNSRNSMFNGHPTPSVCLITHYTQINLISRYILHIIITRHTYIHKNKTQQFQCHYDQQARNQTIKQTKHKSYKTQKLICAAPALHNEKRLMKFSVVSTKTLKMLKCLSEISFNMNTSLLPCFCILFKVDQKVVFTVNTRWNITIQIWHMNSRKLKHISLIKQLGILDN